MKKATAQNILDNLNGEQYDALYNAVAYNLTAKYNNDAVYLDAKGRVRVLVDTEADGLRDDLLKICDLFDNDSYEDDVVFDDWDEDAKFDHAREIVDGAITEIETLIDCNKDEALGWFFVD